MSVKDMLNKFNLFIALLVVVSLFVPRSLRAMPPGTLLFRTGQNGQMFGYQGELLDTENGLIRAINAGHVAIYIGREQGEDYIVEATPAGVVKTPARYFLNRAENETFLGARLPRGLDAVRQAKAVAIARNMAASQLAYDFDFHRQKGARSGEWTCVGLSEKIYESADISNPYNLGALEYDQRYYAIDITPDGFDNSSPANSQGDRFSREKEFSEIARRPKMLFPAPELIGFNAGVERDGRRYLFMPYTQFLQPGLEPVPVDIQIATSLPAGTRAEVNGLAIGLRWSLVNNPLSSLRQIASSVKKAASRASAWLAGRDRTETVVLEESSDGSPAADNQAGEVSRPPAVVTKRSPAVEDGAPSVAPASKPASSEITGTSSQPVISNQKKPVTVRARADSPEIVAPPAGATTPALRTLYNLPATSSRLAAKPAVATSSVQTDSQAQAAADAPKIARFEAIYATGNDDWIELYNPSAYDFDLAVAGYRLEKAKTASDPSLLMRIGNLADGSYPGGTIIKAHGRYLIVRAAAGQYYRSQAQALATRTEFSWTGSGQTIYLATGAVSSSSDEDIVEAVGFGAATYFQGPGPAPEISDKYVLRRQTDSRNNQADFRLVASDDPSLAWDETIPDPEPERPPTAEDDPVPPPAPRLLIGRLYATGGNDWLEIHNPHDYAVDLATNNFRLEKTKSAQDPSLMLRFGNPADGSYPGGTLIAPGGTYLVVRDDASQYYRDQADAIATRTEFGWTGDAYTLYLASGPVSSSADEDIVDAVGFGPAASYFAGSGPAPEMIDGQALERVSDSSDNSQDFRLVSANDPDYAAEPEPEDSRFSFPEPIDSPGLVNIWHFDECYGEGNWVVGRWDCAREVGYNIPGFELALDPAPDLDAFTLAFYYSDHGPEPRLDLRLRGPDDTTALIRLERNLATFEGFPNSEWRYYQPLPFDGSWHQAVIVVNQAADYWAAYLDGQEIVREEFLANLPLMDSLEISSDLNPTLVDEMAVWHRALSPEEVVSLSAAAAPLAPLAERPQPETPVLRYLWEFEEDEGAVAADSIQGAIMSVDPSLWTGRRHNNYALKTGLAAGASAPLDLPLAGQDFSLAYWWQNTAYPKDGQAEITLWGGGLAEEKRLLRLDNNYFRMNYSFNGWDGILIEGLGAGLPLDDLWHHIALVYDSYRYKLSLFVDGQEKLVRPHIWMPPEYGLRRLEIGRSTWPAALDDLRIYSGALNAAEVQELFTNTK